jgi:hypothetical protein
VADRRRLATLHEVPEGGERSRANPVELMGDDPQRDRVGQGQTPQLLRTIHPREDPRAGRRCRQ